MYKTKKGYGLVNLDYMIVDSFYIVLDLTGIFDLSRCYFLNVYNGTELCLIPTEKINLPL